MLFEEIVQQLVNGLTLAAIYALIAVGVSLFFGAIGIVNLAHGDVAAFAAFSAIVAQKLLETFLSVNAAALLSIPIGILVGAAVGWGLYRFAFRPLGEAPPVIGLLAAIASGFIIRESIFNFFSGGRNPQPFTSAIPNVVVEVNGVFVLLKQLVVVGTALCLVVWLATTLNRTQYGRAVRSLVNNREAARTLGVPIDRTLAITFLLGGGLAGVAGVLNGIYYSIVQFDMGVLLTIKGFVAAVIGGLGNIYGALIGALIIGLLEAFTAGFLPKGNAYKDVVVFGALILILLLRPEGILGSPNAKKV
ncbi:MAG: branched-chain amino acid ABC transporter permease [Afipia sp.]|nr:branched-chain amino acid ABC transporter permease [Afipia sp.]